MAYSTQRVTVVGTLSLLGVSISYLDRADINVFFDGLPNPAAWAWVGETGSIIAFAPPISDGVEVLVKRTTSLDKMRHLLTQGAAFNEETMDENYAQLLLLNQEAVEGAALTDIFTDVDFHGYRITNLATAVNPTDAVSLGQATGATSAAAALAQDWATKLGTPVAGGEYSAKHHAQAAADANTNAQAAAAQLPNAVTGGADTFPQVNATGNGWVYRSIAAMKTLLGLKTAAYGDIGTDVQAYDAATMKSNAAVVVTSQHKSALISDNDGAFDLSGAGHDYVCTPTGPITLGFTNIAANAGKRGYILFTNSTNYAVAKGANIKAPSTMFSAISATGDYMLSYHCDGTVVRLTRSEALV